MVCLANAVLPELMLTLWGCSWLHLVASSRDTINCSPQVNLPCTVYTYNDCANREFEPRHMDLYSGPGPAVPLKLNVYQSNVGSRHNSTHYSRPALTVFWWPLSNSFDELTGYEISMQGIKGVAKGTRRCFVIDTRYSNVTANDQAIYNFSISPVFTNSAYHFRILSLPHMRSRGASNTAIVETQSDPSRTAPSEWTTRVDCEVRFDLDLPKVYVEYDLPPVAFKFPGLTLELVLDDNVISKQLSTKPFHLFEAMKHGNYQVWVTPDDPYIYSPRACLCRNSDDVCAGSCLMSYGYCDVTQRDESIGEIVESPTGLARPLVICLTVSAVVIGVIVTLTFFVYRHCRRLKDRQKENPKCTNNNAEHLCTFVQPDNAEESGTSSLCTPVSLKHTDVINKPVFGHMLDSDHYLHDSLLKDSLSNRACPELISLGGQSV